MRGIGWEVVRWSILLSINLLNDNNPFLSKLQYWIRHMLSFDGKDPPGDPVKKFDEPEGLDPGWRTGTKRIDTDQMSLGLVLSLLES